MVERASCERYKSNTSPAIYEDQHAGNTNKTALSRIRRDCCYDRTSAVTSKDAGELG